MPLLGMVDTAVLGHLDSARHLAGVALAGAVFSLIFMGMNFLRMGTTGITAQAVGRGNAIEVRQALWQAVIAALVIAVALVLLHQPVGQFAWWLLDGSESAEHEAAIYFGIRIFSAPATLVNFALIGWFIGLQNSRAPLAIVVTTNVVNILLDLLLVVGLQMQTAGVAIASLVGELTGCAVGLALAIRSLRQWPGRVGSAALFNLSGYREFLAVNTNILIRTITLVGTLSFMTAQGTRFGERVVAANAILMNLQYLLSYGLDGLAHAAEALVGKAWGENNLTAVRRAVSLTLGWSMLVATGFSVLFAIGGEWLVGLLTTIDTVRVATMTFMPWLIISPVISVFSFVFDGVFVGTTWSREMRNWMLVSTFCVFVPVWWLTSGFGNHGLWLAFIAFMAARGLLMGITYHRRLGKRLASAG